MGILNKNSNNCYEKVKKDLAVRDGKVHIVLVHTSISFGNKPEEVYNRKFEEILKNMQNDGYEIIDIKFAIGGTQGLSYETLIFYK